MRIAVDFDGTIVQQDKPYDQTNGQFTFIPGAKEALLSLKAAGHQLLLYSARASKHHRVDVTLDPLWTNKKKKPPARYYEINNARFQEMCDFVGRELPGVFNAIDTGDAGKPTVDVFIDDRAIRLGASGFSWAEIQEQYGDE